MYIPRSVHVTPSATRNHEDMATLMRRSYARVRSEEGFGMVELLIAMSVMAVGILALFAMFQSAILQIRRASTTSTAAALADTEMENYRAIKYAVIGLDEAQVLAADSTYTGDSAYEANPSDRVHVSACGTAPCTNSVPTQTLTGADSSAYRVDTYIVAQQVVNGRPVILVTIVVRDSADPNVVWARVASSFDESTGL